jgi:hypothetical protein
MAIKTAAKEIIPFDTLIAEMDRLSIASAPLSAKQS